MNRPRHFFFFDFFRFGGGTRTSLRMRASKFSKPGGFFFASLLIASSIQAHESAPIDFAQLPVSQTPPHGATHDAGESIPIIDLPRVEADMRSEGVLIINHSVIFSPNARKMCCNLCEPIDFSRVR